MAKPYRKPPSSNAILRCLHGFGGQEVKVGLKPISLQAPFRLDLECARLLVSTDYFELVLPSCTYVQ